MNQEEIKRGRMVAAEGSTPRPWESKAGAVVSEWPPRDHRVSINAKDVIYYGGYPVGESIGAADQALIVWLVNHVDELIDCAEIVELMQLVGLIKMEPAEGALLPDDDDGRWARRDFLGDLHQKLARKVTWAPDGLPAEERAQQ